jgi:phage/plasmid-like protein (TIGR03299 family)
MAHNITEANGRREMAYTGETPWHGLGTRVEGLQSTEAMQYAAGLTWTVSTRPVTYTGATGPLSADGQRAVARDDNDTLLGMVTDRYHPIQNTQAFECLDALVAEGAAIVETAGSIQGGKRVWALATLPETFEVLPGDRVAPYVLVSWGHTGKHSLEVRLTPVRVVCNNTLDMATSGRAQVSIRHSANAKIRIEEARNALGLVRKQIKETQAAYATLAAQPVSRKDAKSYFETVFPAPVAPESPDKAEARTYQEKLDRWNGVQAEILKLYSTGKGLEIPGVRDTAWAAYNAVTEYVDHVYPITQAGTLSVARQESAAFGSYAAVKAEALSLALAACPVAA